MLVVVVEEVGASAVSWAGAGDAAAVATDGGAGEAGFCSVLLSP